MMKFIIFLFFIFQAQITYSQQCDWRPALAEFASFSSLDGDSTCDPLIRETWAEGWKSPCDCVQKKDLYTKLKSKSIQIEGKELLEEVESQSEILVAEAIRSQFINQLEQSVRLDIYLKKGIISTTGNINNELLSDDTYKDFKVNIPLNCRIGKLSEAFKEALDSTSCNKDLLNKRSMLLFGSSNPDNWIKGHLGLMERTVMNELSEKESSSGMCVPYKSFLALSSTNPKRLTYLKVAKAFSNDFVGFQRWVQDRSDPFDSTRIVGDSELSKKGSFLETNSSKDSIMKLVERNGTFNRKISSLQASDLERSVDSSLEDISKADIDALFKTDPIFERMVRDPQFYKSIVEKEKPENINENDPRIIKLISQSQDRSCQALYGSEQVDSDIKQVGQKGRGAKGGRGSGQATDSKSKNILTKFLCDKDFSKDFVDDKFISNYLSPALRKKFKGISKDDANFAISDYLYCKGNTKNLENDLTIFDISNIYSNKIPESDSLNNLVNPLLNPKSDLRSNNEPLAKGNKHYQFNTQVCKHIPVDCKVSSDSSSESCSFTKISESIILKMTSAKNLDDVLTKEITNTLINDKALRKILVESGKLSPEEINTLLILRQQLPTFQKIKAEGEFKSIMGLPSDTAINEDYYLKNKDLITKNPLVSKDLLTRIGWYQNAPGLNSNLAISKLKGESIDDDTSSYFSNYFALADKSDEQRVARVQKSSNGNSASNSPGRSISSTDPANPSSSTITDNGATAGSNSTSSVDSVTGNENVYKRKSFKPVPKEEGRIADTVIPQEIKPEVTKKEQSSDAISSEKVEPTKTTKKIENSQIVLTSSSDTSDTSRFFNGSNNGVYRPKDKQFDQNNNDEQELKKLQDRLDELNGLADELGKSRGEVEDTTRMDEIKKLTDEIRTITNKNNISKINNIRNRANSIISDRRNGSNSNFSSNSNNFSNSSSRDSISGSELNPYDPMDRGTSGRREPEVDEELKDSIVDSSTNASSTSTSKADPKTEGPGGASLTATNNSTGSGGSSKGVKGRGRYPATENNEEDPDDLCGFDQEMNCIFEHASIYNIPSKFPSLKKFIEYLQIQGRSFKAIEVIKRRGKSTRYVIHEFEPGANLTKEQKIKNYGIIKKMLKNYSTNYKKLSEIAGLYVVTNKTEISKQEAKAMQKYILRYADLNKLIDRRLREDN